MLSTTAKKLCLSTLSLRRRLCPICTVSCDIRDHAFNIPPCVSLAPRNPGRSLSGLSVQGRDDTRCNGLVPTRGMAALRQSWRPVAPAPDPTDLGWDRYAPVVRAASELGGLFVGLRCHHQD